MGLCCSSTDQSVNESDLRKVVCAVARSWLGTPYHHMGRVKGAGVDCATFLAEVYAEAGLCAPVPISYYPQDWMLHRSEERYLAILLEHVHEISGPPEPGDIVMYHFGRCWAHGGIVLEWPLIIHALNGKAVLLADGEREGCLVHRAKRFFSLWPDGPRLECP